MAKKCYLIAADNKFLQGRKTELIVGIILYCLCRQNKTMHLLIDFSDVLQTNLYVLGNLYLKLIRLLHFKIPQIDPSLFIQRFCNKLKFGNQSNAISQTALKILQSMKRNWFHLGRRPNGLCGAAILIAASCHQKKRTLDEVVDVVHVCNGTIKKRIMEFSLTPASNITKEELDSIPIIDSETFDLMMDDKGMDPPSFIANRLKDLKTFEKDVMTKTIEIEKKLHLKLNELKLNENSKIRIVFQKTSDKIDPKRYVLEPFPKDIYSKSRSKEDFNSSSHMSKETEPTLTKRRSSRISSRKNSLTGTSQSSQSKDNDDSEILSELNEEEVEMYCLKPEEQKLKKHLWEIMYSDWIEEQELKKKEQEKKSLQNKNKELMSKMLGGVASNNQSNYLFTSKRRKKEFSLKNTENVTQDKIKIEHDNPEEAIIASKRFPKSTNMFSLKKLFN